MEVCYAAAGLLDWMWCEQVVKVDDRKWSNEWWTDVGVQTGLV